MTKKEETIQSISSELEKILTKLEENPDQDIEDTFSAIEKGVDLMKKMQSKLDKLENKFIDIKKQLEQD